MHTIEVAKGAEKRASFCRVSKNLNAGCIPVIPIHKIYSNNTKRDRQGWSKLMGAGERTLRTVLCLQLTFKTSLHSRNCWVVNNWRLERQSWWISLLVRPIFKLPWAFTFTYFLKLGLKSHYGHNHSSVVLKLSAFQTWSVVRTWLHMSCIYPN